ncbi:MAG: hypothetical protein Q8P91_00905 [bacterium]|nr:hypothetical protein [bacterium]
MKISGFIARIIEGGEKAPAGKIYNPLLGPTLQGKSGVEFLQIFVPNMIGLSFVIGVVIFLFIVIIGAIQWTTSGGDKASIESARGKITNALVGIVILFSLFALLKFIEDFFGINILTLDLGVLQIK